MNTPRSLVVAALIAAPVAAGVAPAAGSAATTKPPPACQSRQLVTSLSSPDGTAGSIDYTLQFANLGATCTLSGFPGVSAVNSDGKQLGKAAARTGKAGKAFVLRGANAAMASWSNADAKLQITDVLNFPSTKCKPTFAYGLRVYPPNQKAAVAVPLPFGACTTSTSYMSVSAVRLG